VVKAAQAVANLTDSQVRIFHPQVAADKWCLLVLKSETTRRGLSFKCRGGEQVRFAKYSDAAISKQAKI